MIGQPFGPPAAALGELPALGNFRGFGASVSLRLLGSPARVGRRRAGTRGSSVGSGGVRWSVR